MISRKAPEVLEETIRLIQLLTRTLRVVHYTHLEVLQASSSPPRHFWDRLLAYTYLNNGAEEIVTEDEKPYKGVLRTLNPFKGSGDINISGQE